MSVHLELCTWSNCDCLTTVERWEKSGVTLHVVDLGGNAIDTASAAGRFMLVVLAGAAEMERNLTRERH
ncbi:MAG: recombinase family protein [Planctomycetes bacterium]|nr:recombinase family protein [Planctomycetota bacterium]MBI3835348.1 recombinase family protein [Planctomycetota bacterium]